MNHSFALPSELTIYTVGELRPQWLTWLAEFGEPDADEALPVQVCAVDAAGVDQVDAAGVQLIVALSQALSRRQQVLRLINASGPLNSACEALGLGALLSAPDATGAVS